MNKAELINAIAAESGLSKADSKKALGAFVSSGTFAVSERAARTGINPSTKQAYTIPAKKVAKFKAGAELSEAVE